MKILSLFCDMVRPNILDFSGCNENSFENILISIGGTYYNNCFSPGPDTGRSMGCFWSGLMPQDNGCNSRAKYPKFYLNSGSFLDVLSEENYNMYFFTNPNEKILGCLPPKYDTVGHHNKDLHLDNFIRSIDMRQDNIFAHIALTDFHWALDDYGANSYGVYQGLRVIKESIRNLFRIIPVDEFDYIIIFSDHGFKYEKEFKLQDKIFLLNRDRSNVMMFIHKRNDDGLCINSKLCSLIDFYPTLMEIIGHKYCGYGYSLFSNSEHEFVVCEEHGSFLPEVDQKIEYWAVVKKNVIYLRSYYDYLRDDGNQFELDKNEFDLFLCKHSKSFSEVYKQLKILELYRTMATDKSIYSNGENRLTNGKNDFFTKVKNKIERKLYNW